jgi:hypothetical protein
MHETKLKPLQQISTPHYEPDVNESLHRDITRQITNKMQYIDLFIILSQLYMFRAMFSSIIRSTWLYLQYLVVFTQVAADWCLFVINDMR